MDKPNEFCEERIAARHTPYEQEDTQAGNRVTTGGVLAKGSVVWLSAPLTAADAIDGISGPHVVSAFVEGVGVIRLDRRWLSPGAEHTPERRLQPAAPGIHLIEMPRAKSTKAVERIGPGLVETEPAAQKSALAG